MRERERAHRTAETAERKEIADRQDGESETGQGEQLRQNNKDY